jgi:hypothetical protein
MVKNAGQAGYGLLADHGGHTIAITGDGPVILTDR